MQIEADRIYEQFEYLFEDELRSVGYYDEDESEYVFVRDDIVDQYDESEIDTIFRSARLESLDQGHQESRYRHGELRCTLRYFEERIEFHFTKGEQKGVLATVDVGAVDNLQETVESSVVALNESDS